MRTIRRSLYEAYQFEELVRRCQDLNDRALLDLIEVGWYVETAPCADGQCQSGMVLEILRDKFGLPVCLKIADSDNTYDWVTPDRIILFESDDGFIDDWNYLTWEEMQEEMTALGYTYQDDGSWKNDETGEVVAY